MVATTESKEQRPYLIFQCPTIQNEVHRSSFTDFAQNNVIIALSLH